MKTPVSLTPVLLTAAAMALSQCTGTISVSPDPTPGGSGGGGGIGPAHPAAGQADGASTIATPGQRFALRGKALHENQRSGASDLAAYTISYEITHDPGRIIAIVGGRRIALRWDGRHGYFSGGDSAYTVRAYPDKTSASGQVALGSFIIDAYGTGVGPDDTYTAHTVHGLETAPATIANAYGTATYSGPARISVVHDSRATNGGRLAYGNGTGTARLNVDFGSGRVDGRMSLTDAGTSTPGYDILPTTVYLAPSRISGNGFSTRLNIPRPADLGLSRVQSSQLDGKFYGLNASDVGGTFSGSGISGNGSAGAIFQGAFIGQ